MTSVVFVFWFMLVGWLVGGLVGWWVGGLVGWLVGCPEDKLGGTKIFDINTT